MSEWTLLSFGTVAILGGWSFLRVIAKEVLRRERHQDVMHRRSLMEIRLKKLIEPPVDVHPPEEIVAAAAGDEPAEVDGAAEGS